jgi:hypothetical protein
MAMMVKNIDTLYAAPGWMLKSFKATSNSIEGNMVTTGSTLQDLMLWSNQHGYSVVIKSSGVTLTGKIQLPGRKKPDKIFPIKDVIAIFYDRLMTVSPKSTIAIVVSKVTTPFANTKMTIRIINASPMVLSLIGQQMKDLPISFESATLTLPAVGNKIDGSIVVRAYGN